MLIRIASDLHIEFGYYKLPELPEDSKTVLVLAGDVGLFKHVITKTYLEELSERFQDVIYVPGNHEYYGYTLYDGVERFKKEINDLLNVHILNNETMDIFGTRFICSTLWTSFRNGNPMSMMQAEEMLNDYRKIRLSKTKHRKLRAHHLLPINQQAKDYVFAELEKAKGKCDSIVVVTHHGPSYQSMSPKYSKTSVTNDAYFNNYDYEVAAAEADFWIHGHTHESTQYFIGKTHVVCNPKGYAENNGPGYQNTSFKPCLRFEI